LQTTTSYIASTYPTSDWLVSATRNFHFDAMPHIDIGDSVRSNSL
jgi:hypothetical protein